MSDLRVTIQQLFLVWITTCVAGHSGNWNYNVSFLFRYNLSENSFNAVLFSLLKPLPLPLRCSQGLHLFCVPRVWPGLGNASTQQTWAGVSLDQPHCPLWLWPWAHLLFRAQSSIYPAPGLCFAFGSKLRWAYPYRVLQIPLQSQEFEVALWAINFVWPRLSAAGPGPACAVNGKAARVTLSPSVPCFVALCGSFTQYRSGCCSAVHLQGVTNILPYSQHSPFISNF